MPRINKPALVSLIVLFSLFATFFTSPPLKAEDGRFFGETGHTVSGKFLEYWNRNGGLWVFGYPITDAQLEVDPETGKTFLTQWFERARFELHPENAGTKYEVLLGLLGKQLRREALGLQREFTPAVPYYNPEEVGQFFEATGHNVTGKILTYWQNNGGLERYGYPISEAHKEVDPETGKVYVSQWFERARFELHPENQAPYDVLLGLLGNQIKNKAKLPLTYGWTMEGPASLLGGEQGIAVDSRGNFYIASYDHYISSRTTEDHPNKARIFKFDQYGRLILNWSLVGQQDKLFYSLNGLAIDRQDNLYVSDWTSGYIEKMDTNGRFLKKLGGKGDQPGLFTNPGSMAFDVQNNMYVLDAGLNKVQKFDSNGNYLLSWGSAGQGNGEFKNPHSISVDGAGNVYVADTDNLRVQKFDSNGQYLWQWGGYGTGDGQFMHVPGVAHTMAYGGPASIMAGADRVYVADWAGHRIQLFDLQGKFLTSWTKVSAFDANLYPKMALDATGNLYLVADGPVEKYSPDKQLQGKWTYVWKGLEVSQFDKLAVDEQNNVYVSENKSSGLSLLKMNGAGQKLLEFDTDCGIKDIAVRKGNGDIYLLCSSSVKVFDSNGHFLREWGGEGDKDGQFKTYLSNLTLDKAGNVYVLDNYHRIQKFDANGKFLKKWDLRNKNNTDYEYGNDLATDSQDRLYVSVDGPEKGVQIYDGEGNLKSQIEGVDPLKMTTDGQDNVYVLNQSHSLVKIKNGAVVWEYDYPREYFVGLADGSLKEAESIAVDSQGNLYALGGFSGVDWLLKMYITE